MSIHEEALDVRKNEFRVQDFIRGRWSPRAMSGESISDEELMGLFEAARWAPSSYNGQPWRFIYAKRDTQHWDKLFQLLVEQNQVWAKKAAVLIVVISRRNFEHNEKPANTHGYDTGSAWENLSLEGASRGLAVHGVAGFDYDKAKSALGIPDAYEVMAMAVVGKRGKKEDLPEAARGMESPSDRKKVREIIMEGSFSER